MAREYREYTEYTALPQLVGPAAAACDATNRGDVLACCSIIAIEKEL